jgi:putative hydroxymethylpyrimidine transport system substrate-binding protein
LSTSEPTPRAAPAAPTTRAAPTGSPTRSGLHSRAAASADLRRRPRGRGPLLALACLALALALGACGAKQDVISAPGAKRFTIMLDWFPNADHAALYAGIAHGDFRTVGLNVEPVVPSETAEPLKLLAAGKVDMAISYEPQLLLARDQGLKLVSIAALVQRPLTSIIALPEQHVHDVAQLAGKTVGTAGIPYQAAELRSIMQHAGVSPS